MLILIIEYKETNSSTCLASSTIIAPKVSSNYFNFTSQVVSQEKNYNLNIINLMILEQQ